MGGFIAGSRHAALEFSANIGKRQLEVIDLIKFDEAGEMTEFEIMIGPIKALEALGDDSGTKCGTRSARMMRLKPAAAALR